MPLENLINKKDQKGLGSLIKKTKSPYAMSEEEAIQYALKMGFTDSWRGIQQIYGEITNSDDLLEKLSAKDKKLDEIFKNPEYGDKAMGFYLGAAIGGDPIGYVPFLGWGKKINGIGKATAFGTGMGAFQSGIAYQSEGMDRGERALTGATIGGIIG
jgi:DNA-binding ferritin-like protein (Dps family)